MLMIRNCNNKFKKRHTFTFRSLINYNLSFRDKCVHFSSSSFFFMVGNGSRKSKTHLRYEIVAHDMISEINSEIIYVPYNMRCTRVLRRNFPFFASAFFVAAVVVAVIAAGIAFRRIISKQHALVKCVSIHFLN